MTHGTLTAGAWYLHQAPTWSLDVQLVPHDQQMWRATCSAWV
ncbi:hypothetical protein ACFY0R_17665 [Streptomyces sp. NPDC001633]